MHDILAGKTIIVSGTARGIGRQMVETFAENGANVIALARTRTEEHETQCEAIAKQKNVMVRPMYFDLTDEEEMKDVIKEIRKEKMLIDGLVNNAGITLTALSLMTRMEDMERIFDNNFFAVFAFTQYIAKLMMKNRKGSIVNISSTAALDGNSGKAAYGASKAALLNFTKTLSEEMGEYNIRVNTVCPGATMTPMLRENMHDYILEEEKNASALKKIGIPEDVANVTMFLLSDMASYITGQALRVDGGVTRRKKGK